MLKDFEDYIIELDSIDINIANNKVDELGIEEFLTQQLYYLDCTRISNNGMRLMQTIGYPYRRELSLYLYALENKVNFLTVKDSDISKFNKDYWINKLLERHTSNIEYEKENPPVWYGGKKAKDNWDKQRNKLPRRRNKKEQTIPGFDKEVKAAQRLKKLATQFGTIKFKIKL